MNKEKYKKDSKESWEWEEKGEIEGWLKEIAKEKREEEYQMNNWVKKGHFEKRS